MVKSVPATPQTQNPKSPVRLPEEISGDEQHEDPKPIAAEQPKPGKKPH